MPAHGLLTRRLIVLNPTTTANYNIRTAAGNPSDSCDIIVNVNSGVVLSSVSTGGGYATGSQIQINVYAGGQILGSGGNGGHGGNASSAGTNGGPGGDALTINGNVRVYIAIYGTGLVAAGGGGGGGGGSNIGAGAGHLDKTGGGGGGGGQGSSGGSHGTGGTGTSGYNGQDGTDGTEGSRGAGGLGNQDWTTHAGGNGGYGGVLADWGQAGQDAAYSGGYGGPPGVAIYSVGYIAPTITAGNDGQHIWGAIVT